MATESELRAEIETVEKQLVDQNYIAKAVEAGDRRFGDNDWQVAQAALPVLASRLKSLQGRLGSVIGGGGDPGGETKATSTGPRMIAISTKTHADRPFKVAAPIYDRDDLVRMGERDYDDIFGISDAADRAYQEALDDVDGFFRDMRKIYADGNTAYVMDKAVFQSIRSMIALLRAGRELDAAQAGVLRRELEVKLSDRIDALERRLEATEKGGVRWMGTFQRAIVYQKGDVAQVAGSAWICLANSSTGIAPDSDPTTWQLFEKRRDARR